MLALSLRQPWLFAVLFGGKDVENRTWVDARSFELMASRKRFLLHEATGLTKAQYDDAREFMIGLGELRSIAGRWIFKTGAELPTYDDMRSYWCRGAIVASARIVDILKPYTGKVVTGYHWHMVGQHGLVLADVRMTGNQVLIRGYQKWFDVSEEILERAGIGI